MAPRIGSLALTLTVLLTACGDDKGSTSQTTSGDTTGGSTTSQATATDGSATDGSATDGSTTDGTATDGTATDGSSSGPTSGGVDPGIKEDCLARVEFDLQSITYSCTCEVMDGNYPDVETCLLLVGEDPVSQATDKCACEYYAADPSNASAEACRQAKFQAFAECLAPLMCSDNKGRQACFDAFLAPPTCEFNSDASEAQVELQCNAVNPYMCGSGETIPDTWVCDSLNNCMDGSDEKNC